jgi:hypothetical protein
MRRALAVLMAVVFLASMAGVVIDGVSGQDVVPPRVTGVRVTTIGETWFEVEWQTDEPAHGGIEWGRKKAYGNVSEEFEGFVTDHLLNVTGLKKGKLYHFRVYAVDLEGNEGHSNDITVGTYPYGEDDDGISLGASLVIALIIAVPVVYLLFIRPAGQ